MNSLKKNTKKTQSDIQLIAHEELKKPILFLKLVANNDVNGRIRRYKYNTEIKRDNRFTVHRQQ